MGAAERHLTIHNRVLYFFFSFQNSINDHQAPKGKRWGVIKMTKEKMLVFIKKECDEQEQEDGMIRSKIIITVNVSQFFCEILSKFKVGNVYNDPVGYSKLNGQRYTRCKVKTVMLNNIGAAGRILFSKYDKKFSVSFRNLTDAERFICDLKQDVTRMIKVFETVEQTTTMKAVMVENGGDEQ